MEAKNFEGRQTWSENAHKDDEFEDDNEEEESSGKKLGAISGSRGPHNGGCQAERCGADLTDAKRYHRRHKVCEFHSKAPVVIVSGLPQRFCQQCSRFHEVSEFDETKRSCRRRLAGHNERRRKSSAESHGEGSSRRGSRESQTRQVDDQRSRVQITQSVSSTYKHLHIR